MRLLKLALSLFFLLTLLIAALPMKLPRVEATDGTSYYDFISNASEASWSSGGGILPFPGSDSDSRGFACYKENIQLEDGVTYGRVLETHPDWTAYGSIQGTYPEMTVMSGTVLVFYAGFLQGAEGTDGVHLQVNFSYWSGGRRIKIALESVDVYNDGHLTYGRVALDSYAGKTGQFTLYAGAGPSSGRDWAAWAQAEIRPVHSLVTILTDCPLSAGTVGSAYSVRLEAMGAEVPPFHWLVTDGTLPPGLSLHSLTGIISGTPTAAGLYSFRISVYDSNELDGAFWSEPKDCYIQISQAGITPTPPAAFDFTLSVSPIAVSINLDPVASGSVGSVEATTTATVSIAGGIAETVTLSLSGVPAGVSSYCLPRDGLPPFTSTCGFIVYVTSTLPAAGDYSVTVTATGGGGITRTQTITLRLMRGVYGDLDIVSVEPVQVVYGAPLIKGKATAFRVKVHSTFTSTMETNFKLELPEDEWDTSIPYTPPVSLPSGWEYPEIWGPVDIPPGDSMIMLPWIPAGQEDAAFDPELNPAGIIEGTCRAPVGEASCYPDLRAVPRPEVTGMVTYTVIIDPWDAVHETDERNNEQWGGASVLGTKELHLYFVIHMSNATENNLLYCQNFNCTTGCCSGPPSASCAGGSRTIADVLDEIDAYAENAAAYLLGVMPISDMKIMYAVDHDIKYEDNYSNYMSSMVALARENGYDYVLSVQPWGYCGCCHVGSAGCYVEVFGGPSGAAHELAGHGIQRIGYECYAPSPDACPSAACPDCWCSEVASSSCAASEGFWVNEWAAYGSGSWTSPWIVQAPTYYMDGVGPTNERWQRLDNPWRYSDGRELRGGYLDLAGIFRIYEDPEVLLARGTVHRDGSAALGLCTRLENGVVDIEAGGEGEYYLVLIDSTGGILSKSAFDISFYMMYPEPEGMVEMDRADFVYRIEWLAGTKRIEIQDGDGATLASKDVSPNKPQINLLYPNGGEVFAPGEEVKIKWQASDADGDSLIYSLAMSNDSGETWLPVDIDIADNKYEWNTEGLDEGQNYLIRVRATDGVNANEDVSDGVFTIGEETSEGEEGGLSLWLIVVTMAGALALIVVVVWVAVHAARRPKKG